MKEKFKNDFISKVIACKHLPEETEQQELNIIVDHGGIIKDVIVEHQVYGDLTATLMIKNRRKISSQKNDLNERCTFITINRWRSPSQ
ncbi:hypothetical protein KHA80_04750 [Anaerobacillus sp. HL2]|nr:hypothetical protein KHA80_04750 [Anaerobacillus sp. HL2]